jgi:hypothetical protein
MWIPAVVSGSHGRSVLRKMVCAEVDQRSKPFAVSSIDRLPADNLVPIAFGAAAMLAVALLAVFVPARFASRWPTCTRFNLACAPATLQIVRADLG